MTLVLTHVGLKLKTIPNHQHLPKLQKAFMDARTQIPESPSSPLSTNFGPPPAIFDQLVHNAHHISLKGESMHKTHALRSIKPYDLA